MQSEIVVKQVSTRKEQKLFCEFPLMLYKNSPHFVPLLFGDEMTIFSQKNIYAPISHSKFYLCYKDGVLAGRVSAIEVLPYIKKSGRKVMRFTRIDFIDDYNVSRALFDAVKKDAIKKGYTEIQGPMGYSDMEREGLLVEGFDKVGTYIANYNYEYYPAHFEAYGLKKETDWLAYKLNLLTVDGNKIERLAGMVAKRTGFREVSGTMSVSELVKRYSQKLFSALNAAYEPLHGTIEITGDIAEKIIAMLKMMIMPEFFSVIVDSNDDVVGFGIAMPSLNEPLIKYRGKINPFSIISLLRARNKPKNVELGLIAVRPEYQKGGVSAMIIDHILKGILQHGITHCETNLELETNDDVISLWNNIKDKEQIKRYRCYKMDIN